MEEDEDIKQDFIEEKNYDELSGSVTPLAFQQLITGSKENYPNLNIDFNSFENHVFFGSAKSKLEGFKNKAVRLEGLHYQLSQSLEFSSSLKVVERRKHLFKEIENGVEICDIIHYSVPLGFIGSIINALWIKKDLDSIFKYRYQVINDIFKQEEGK